MHLFILFNIFFRLEKNIQPKIFEESSDEEDEETPEEKGINISFHKTTGRIHKI